MARFVYRKQDSTHIKIVKKVYRLLPITQIVLQVAPFDIQKIKNFGISGKDYQQGDQLGFLNAREYVL
jgi:N6-L-threonylcarbamoyladenine synthase